MRHFAGLLAIIPLAALCGDGDIVFGPCAMETAAGTDWNISVGAAAMYGSRVESFNAAIGHRAGEYSALCVSNVFVGVRAGKSATNCSNCVGIGVDSLRGAQGESGTVDINGRFVSRGGGFRVSSGSGAPELVYEQGALSVVGDLHVSGNLVFTNHEFTATDTYIGGYDLYVDAVRGDDGDDGSLIYPKKTLDAALSLVNRNGMRICVRAGTYSFPDFFKKGMGVGSAPTVPYRVDLYGVDGAERTIVRNDTDDPAWIANYPASMATMKGFTFVGFRRSNLHSGVCQFNFTYFEDCIFKDTACSVTKPDGSAGDAIFEECILNRCKVSNCSFTATAVSGYYYRSVFNGCKLYGCDVGFTSPDGSVVVATATQLEDTFINVPSSVYGATKRTWNNWLPEFSDGRAYNSTVAISNVLVNIGAKYFYNCIVGMGGADAASYTECFHTNSAPYVLSILGDDLRPKAEEVRADPTLRFTGYGALQDIMTKNALVSFVASAVRSGIPQGASEETVAAMLSVSSNLTASASQPAGEPPSPYDGYYVTPEEEE